MPEPSQTRWGLECVRSRELSTHGWFHQVRVPAHGGALFFASREDLGKLSIASYPYPYPSPDRETCWEIYDCTIRIVGADRAREFAISDLLTVAPVMSENPMVYYPGSSLLETNPSRPFQRFVCPPGHHIAAKVDSFCDEPVDVRLMLFIQPWSVDHA